MKHLNKFNENTSFDGRKQPTALLYIPTEIIKICKEYNIADDSIADVFADYVDHLLGVTFGQEGQEFRLWCDKDDNIVDYLDEE